LATSTKNLYASIFDGSSWSLTPTNLNVNEANESRQPQIAINNVGTAIAVWLELQQVYASVFDGISWSAVPTQLSITTDANLPQIAISNDGTAIAVWEETNTSVSVQNVYASVFDGSSWQTIPTNLNSNENFIAGDVQISINDAGTAIAVWTETNPLTSTPNVYASVYDGTSWSATPTNLNNNESTSSGTAQIAINNLGHAVAVWVEGSMVFASMFDGTSWTSPTNVSNAINSRLPKVSFNDDDHAIVVWHEGFASFPFKVYVRSFDGSSWGAKINLASNPASDARLPRITLNNSDNAITSWTEANNIYARQTALPYYFSQWNSPVLGTQQYISTVRTEISASYIDIYSYAPTTSISTYMTSITLSGTIDHFAVYNKSDTELYYVVITHNPETLTEWLFNGSTVTQIADLSSQVIMPTHDAQWWAPSATRTYVAVIGDVDVSVLDLVDSGNSNALGAQGQDLLWTTTTNYTGLVVLNNNLATPYKVDLTTSPVSITAGTAVTAPTGFTFTALSTCGDYIAVGLTSTDTTAYGYARLALLNLDSTTNTLSYELQMILPGQIEVSSLARCCCCATERPLLIGSYDIARNYNVNVYEPDLSAQIAATLLGQDVKSVAWSCQGINRYLTASSLEYNGFEYTVVYVLDTGLSLPIVVTH
jgi:hypothetical protein